MYNIGFIIITRINLSDTSTWQRSLWRSMERPSQRVAKENSPLPCSPLHSYDSFTIFLKFLSLSSNLWFWDHSSHCYFGFHSMKQCYIVKDTCYNDHNYCHCDCYCDSRCNCYDYRNNDHFNYCHHHCCCLVFHKMNPISSTSHPWTFL